MVFRISLLIIQITGKRLFEPVPKYEEYVENGAAKYRAIDYTVVENNIPSGFAASIQKVCYRNKNKYFLL